jgi:hypothetical protein
VACQTESLPDRVRMAVQGTLTGAGPIAAATSAAGSHDSKLMQRAGHRRE